MKILIEWNQIDMSPSALLGLKNENKRFRIAGYNENIDVKIIDENRITRNPSITFYVAIKNKVSREIISHWLFEKLRSAKAKRLRINGMNVVIQKDYITNIITDEMYM